MSGAGHSPLIDRAAQRPSIAAHLGSIFRYRELIRSLVLKELRLKYRGSILGFMWSLVNPLAMVAIAFRFILTTGPAAGPSPKMTFSRPDREQSSMVSRNHVIISGTGRAGTTFLVELLTHLGLDTGFDVDAIELSPLPRAGLETDIRAATAPYIVKDPFLCDLAEEVLASSVRIEHVIIPIRVFDAAAASRAYVQQLTTGNADGKDVVCGGLWDTDKADEQAGLLRLKFTRLVEMLVRHDIPMTFVWYPRLVRDADYLYAKLKFLLKDIDLASFRTVLNKIVRPEWVHQFTADDS